MRYCTHIWYEDWKCSECCQGDRCNYYVIVSKGLEVGFIFYVYIYGFGGLGVTCWPLVPKFTGSNPAEVVGFLRAKKSSARLPLEGK